MKYSDRIIRWFRFLFNFEICFSSRMKDRCKKIKRIQNVDCNAGANHDPNCESFLSRSIFNHNIFNETVATSWLKANSLLLAYQHSMWSNQCKVLDHKYIDLAFQEWKYKYENMQQAFRDQRASELKHRARKHSKTSLYYPFMRFHNWHRLDINCIKQLKNHLLAQFL